MSKQPLYPCVVFSVRDPVSSISLCFLCLAEDGWCPAPKASGSPHPNPSDPQTPRASRLQRAGPPPWGTFAQGCLSVGKGRLLVKLSQWLKQHPRPAPLLNNCTVKADAVFLLCAFLWKTRSVPAPQSRASWVLCRRLSRVLVSCLTCSSGVFRMSGAVDRLGLFFKLLF